MMIRSFGIFVLIMFSPEKCGGPTAKFCIGGFVYVTHMCLAEIIFYTLFLFGKFMSKVFDFEGEITGRADGRPSVLVV